MSGTRSPRFRSRVSGSKARVRATGPRAVLGQDDAAARLSAEEGPRRGPHRLAARLSEERRLRQQLVAPAARWLDDCIHLSMRNINLTAPAQPT